MKNKSCLTLLLMLLAQLALANMASPEREGTWGSSPFSSKDIDIRSEKIYIKIAPDYSTAKFVIEYTIQSDSSGRQVPLLFYAIDFKDSFYVWLDNKPVKVQNLAELETSYTEFVFPFEQDINLGTTKIYWDKDFSMDCRTEHLKYFEADIKKGRHTIRVEYTAEAWLNLRNWVSEYSLHYSLTPANYWKSFGTLNIIVEQGTVTQQFEANVGPPNEKEIKSRNTWTFHELPADYLVFTYTPEISTLASVLLAIQPSGFFLISSILLIVLHRYLTLRYRRNHLQIKYSVVVILGSLLVPFLMLLSFIFAFPLIDLAIGEGASHYHGYYFLVIFLYPFILIVYWLIFWFIDRRYKRKLLNNNIHLGR